MTETPPVQISSTFASRLTIGDTVRLTPDGPWLTVKWISHGCCSARVTWTTGEFNRLSNNHFVEWMERA